jgi:hypothetical protein
VTARASDFPALRDNRAVAKITPLSWRRRWLPAGEVIAYRIPVVTQDNDYNGMPDLEIIRIVASR